jgi:hypothetical protein
MTQRLKTTTKKRRGITFLWIAGLTLLVFFLIYFEQTALLYILSTLGVTVLLVIVAAADLGAGELSSAENDQAPAAKGAK